MKRYVAEAIGTFALIFFGVGAVIANTHADGALGVLGIAAVFGLTLTAMIYSIGEISGCHLNPAVTLAFCVAGLFKWKDSIGYIGAQFGGGFLAALLLRFLFPANERLGTTAPTGTPMESFVLEIVLTFFLMFVILFTTQCSKAVGTLAGIAIGGTLMVGVLVGGTISGGSLNPVRSIAPAVVFEHAPKLWIYIAAPIIGAIAASGVWMVLGTKKEC